MITHRSRIAEQLEDRLVLSVTPTVTSVEVASVEVASTQWDTDFLQYLQDENLGENGYAVPDGSPAQTLNLPWTNIDQIMIEFSEDVVVQQSHLTMTGVNTQQYDFANFSYNSTTKVATWTLSETMGIDKVMLDLAGDGLNPVENEAGTILDGEWTDNSSSFNSGNGTAGGDFEFTFHVCPGDVNQSGSTTLIDYRIAYYANGLDTEDSAYSAFHDINGSGSMDSLDTAAMYQYVNQGLPSGTPAGADNDAPTTAGFTDVAVNENAANEVISLWTAYDDAEDLDSELTFSIASNSNSALFTSATVDNTTGQLTLDFDDDAYGVAALVIRATDSEGLYVDAAMHVDINAAPVIVGFYGSVGPANTWVFTGTVTDADDDVDGYTVNFSGVLAGAGPVTTYTAGYFQLIIQLPEFTFGNALAQTEDPEGAESDWVSFLVG